MSPKFLFVVMVALLAIPTVAQSQSQNRLSPEEIQRRVDERAAQIAADKEEAKRLKQLRKGDKTRDQKEARRQVEKETRRDLKAFEKAKIIGCSPDETIVHPEAHAKLWGPKVTFEVHNPRGESVSILNGNEMMIEDLCPRGIAKVSVSAWVMGPLVSYGSPYAPYGGRRRDGRDVKVVRLTAVSDSGVVFSPEVVIDYYQVLYNGHRRDPYVWIVPDPPQQGQVSGRGGISPQMAPMGVGPGVSMFGTSQVLSVPMPGYIERSLMLPSEKEAEREALEQLEQQAEPVVEEEIIEISPDDNR